MLCVSDCRSCAAELPIALTWHVSTSCSALHRTLKVLMNQSQPPPWFPVCVRLVRHACRACLQSCAVHGHSVQSVLLCTASSRLFVQCGLQAVALWLAHARDPRRRWYEAHLGALAALAEGNFQEGTAELAVILDAVSSFAADAYQARSTHAASVT